VFAIEVETKMIKACLHHYKKKHCGAKKFFLHPGQAGLTYAHRDGYFAPMSNDANSNLNIESASQPVNEPQVLSVETLNRMIRGQIESRFTQVWVKGELSNFKAHTSGHFYFSLKDANSQIRAVMFRGYNSKLRFRPHDGLEVLIRGKVTVFEPRGEYQITCDTMEPVGAGALQKAFEQLKEKLKREGLFESSRKRPLPNLPRHIAIVTSPTGAAIRDILNILQRRARGIDVTIVPTLVQGEAAAPALREAFQKALQLPNVEVVIIGRGGGSIEDMWCFNDEGLARLIAQSPIPVISAVGHEIDFTISDFVADVRAPTPSAAAELVIKSAEEVMSRVLTLRRMLLFATDRFLKTNKQKLVTLHHRLVDPQRRIQDLIQRNDDLSSRLNLSIQRHLQRLGDRILLLHNRMGTPEHLLQQKRARLEAQSLRLRMLADKTLTQKRFRLERTMGLLDSLSPLKVVDRGYSLVTKNGELVKSTKQVQSGDQIELQVTDGKINAKVL
jgi:exodeoxyribonuclease VII large subunit